MIEEKDDQHLVPVTWKSQMRQYIGSDVAGKNSPLKVVLTAEDYFVRLVRCRSRKRPLNFMRFTLFYQDCY